MNQSLLFGLWLACLACCQSVSATPFLPFFAECRLLADTIPPVITCPASDTVQLSPGQCGQIVQYAVTATDNQPGVTILQASGLASGATFPIGVTVNTFIAMDTAGNAAPCSFAITVRNFSNMLFCKQSVTVQLGANCSHPIVPADVLVPNANGCSANFVVEVDKTFPFGNGPWLPATMTATDVNKSYQFRLTAPTTGNRCVGSAEIKDTLPPTISCQDINLPCIVSNLAPAYLNDSLSISAGQPAYADNCGSALSVSYTDASINLSCDPASTLTGIITRTWTVKDVSNNQRSCVQKINRIRSLTDVQFPPTVTLGCINPNLSPQRNGVPFIAVGGVRFPLLSNAACGNEMTFFDTLVPQCGSSRIVQRTWKVQDLCRPLSASNPKIGVQNLLIRDTGIPVVTCPPTTIVRVDGLGCQGNVQLPSAVITDGCSNIAKFTVQWPATEGGQILGHLSNWPGNNPALRDTLGGVDSLEFLTGATTVQYNATDACGNTGTCSFTLIVTDTLPPTVFCRPFLTVQLSTDGHLQWKADSLDDGSTDMCTAVSFKARRQLSGPCQANDQLYDAVSFCCSDLGDTVALQVRVYDIPLPAGAVALNFASAYASECTVRVRVTNPHPPTCTAPLDTVVSCTVFDPDLSSYGNLLDRSCTADSLKILVDYSQFDTTCRRGEIVRTFRVTDTAGNSGECTQQIIVSPAQQHYFVRFPNDTIVSACMVANAFGEPLLFGLDCERTEVTYTDRVINDVPGACFKIERLWKIVNRCHYDSLQPLTIVPNPEPNALMDAPNNLLGPTVSASGTTGVWAPTLSKLAPADASPTNFSTFWSVNVNGYQYKQIIRFIDNQDPIFDNCPSTTLAFADSTINSNELWNENHWLDSNTGLYDLSDAPILLSATAFDACRGGNISLYYTLFLDLDGNGDQETVIKGNQPPAFGTVNFGNGFNTNYAGGTPRNFDERTVPNGQKYGFALETATVNHKKTAWVRWNTAQTPSQYSNPQLPRGQHKIIWTAEDSCGNATTCQYNFTIRDGLPPVLTCSSVPVLRNIAANQLLQLNVSAFPLTANDNYTPPMSLQYALRRPGTGTGFPVDSSGFPNRNVTYTCDELGIQQVHLWVRDQENNAGFCTAYVMVQDPDSICTKSLVRIGGTISNPLDIGIAEVQMGIYATYLGLLPYSATVATDSAGHYAFANPFPPGTAYTLTPTKDGNDLNGVTTFDLVLISRHILGINSITSPYKLIAADANKSNSITTLDIVELRKLILGVYDNGLPLTKSWRFVDKSFVFPNPTNPFQTPFPETSRVDSLVTGQPADHFVGIKIGDVDCSALPNVSGPVEERTNGTLWWEVTDRMVQPGETIDVRFQAVETVAGYQFTLEYSGLEVLNIQPGAGMTLQNFAVFAARNALTTSFDAAESAGPPEFTLRFRIRQPGHLSRLLHLSGRITPAAAYSPDAAQPSDIGLRFNAMADTSNGFALLPCIPNPFQDKTTIGFHLPKATTATMSVFNATGQVVYRRTIDYAAGSHTLTMDKSDLGETGVFFYQLQTPMGSAVQKMVLLR